MADPFLAWVDALVARHTQGMTRPEFLKAIRALSARYVERRRELPGRSAIDSAGKRAAFAAFYAPLHFLTVRAVVRQLRMARSSAFTVIDLGCGTGVAGAAWALECSPAAHVRGVDLNAWALTEARWSWRQMGLQGRASQEDFTRTLGQARAWRADSGVVLAWSANELAAATVPATIDALVRAAGRGHVVLVVEPIATRVTPWWRLAADTVVSAGGRADEWHFDVQLPRVLAELDRDAGFTRDGLTARSLALGAGAR